MPTVYEINGYKIYIWANEAGEPIHVHIAKSFTPNGTKVWLLSDGSVEVAHNKSRIPKHKLKALCQSIQQNRYEIEVVWRDLHHGFISYYK